MKRPLILLLLSAVMVFGQFASVFAAGETPGDCDAKSGYTWDGNSRTCIPDPP